MGELPWESAFLTHPGAVRSVNEDAFLEAPDIGLWAVADGMGGHQGGQTASRMVVDALDALIPGAGGLAEAVQQELDIVNAQLRTLAHEAFGGRTIGSTVAVLILSADSAICLWAGDSRIYRLREGCLQQLTLDHSRIEEMVRDGVIDRDRAASHPLANIITRAVGGDDELRLDRCSDQARDGDRFLLCTDGLSRVISDGEIEAMMKRDTTANAAQHLLEAALSCKPADNVTLGIVQFGASSDPTTVVGARNQPV